MHARVYFQNQTIIHISYTNVDYVFPYIVILMKSKRCLCWKPSKAIVCVKLCVWVCVCERGSVIGSLISSGLWTADRTTCPLILLPQRQGKHRRDVPPSCVWFDSSNNAGNHLLINFTFSVRSGLFGFSVFSQKYIKTSLSTFFINEPVYYLCYSPRRRSQRYERIWQMNECDEFKWIACSLLQN